MSFSFKWNRRKKFQVKEEHGVEEGIENSHAPGVLPPQRSPASDITTRDTQPASSSFRI